MDSRPAGPADRLRTAGCPVSTAGTDWLSAGDFGTAFLEEAPGERPGRSAEAGGGTEPLHSASASATAAEAMQQKVQGTGAKGAQVKGDSNKISM